MWKGIQFCPGGGNGGDQTQNAGRQGLESEKENWFINL